MKSLHTITGKPKSRGGAQRLIPLLAFFVGGTLGCGGTSSAVNMPEASAPVCRLQLPLREIDLGTIPQRGTAKKQLEVYNPGPERVEVVFISTSCPCLQVKLSDHVLEPYQKTWCLVDLDMMNEPDFSGKLRIAVFAYTSKNSLAFKLGFNVDVVKKSFSH